MPANDVIPGCFCGVSVVAAVAVILRHVTTQRRRPVCRVAHFSAPRDCHGGCFRSATSLAAAAAAVESRSTESKYVNASDATCRLDDRASRLYASTSFLSIIVHPL